MPDGWGVQSAVQRLQVPTLAQWSEKGWARTQSNDPLHGVTLETIVRRLVDEYDWNGLAMRIDINCFKSDPSVSSTLKFLRKTPWARKRVEDLFVNSKLRTRDQP